METSRIDAVVLLVAAAAGGFALNAAPANFGYLSTIEGITLLLVLFGYDRQGYRSGLQSLAFSAAAAICLALAGAYGVQVFANPGASLPQILALIWAGATVILSAIDRSRMSGRTEAWPAQVSQPAGLSFLAQTAPPAPTPVFSPSPIPAPVSAPIAFSASAEVPAPPRPPFTFTPQAAAAPVPVPDPVPSPNPPAAAAPLPRTGKEVTIFVNLVGEAMNMLRAVRAEHAGRDFYLIVEEMPAGETWEFTTGQLVRVKKKNLSNGKGLVAFEEAPRAN